MQFTELDQEDWRGEQYLETIMEVESICSRQQSVRSVVNVLPELPLYAHRKEDKGMQL